MLFDDSLCAIIWLCVSLFQNLPFLKHTLLLLKCHYTSYKRTTQICCTFETIFLGSFTFKFWTKELFGTAGIWTYYSILGEDFCLSRGLTSIFLLLNHDASFLENISNFTQFKFVSTFSCSYTLRSVETTVKLICTEIISSIWNADFDEIVKGFLRLLS